MITNRFRRLFVVLLAGFRLWISYASFNLFHFFSNPARKKDLLSRLHEKNANYLLKKSTRLKGAIIKIAQLLATRPDFLPQEYCDILSQLQDQMDPIKYQGIKKTFREEFQKDATQIFDEFEEQPFACASLGQVHRARNGSRQFAVKVQYPGIDRIVHSDLKNFKLSLSLFGKRLYASQNLIFSIFEELKKHILQEIDYYREAENILIFRKMFANSPYVRIPRVYPEYSRLRIITMDFMEGEKITDMFASAENPLIPLPDSEDKTIKRKDLVFYRVVEAFADQILKHGVFQADAHPGNILITTDNNIVIIDFGLIKRLSEKMRDELISLALAIVEQDISAIEKSFTHLGFKTDIDDPAIFKYFGNIFLNIFRNEPLEEIEQQYRYLNALLRKERIAAFPQDMILMMRVFVALNGLQNIYKPEHNFNDIILKYKRSYERDIRRQAKRIFNKVLGAIESPELIQEQLRDSQHILEKIQASFEKTEKKIRSDKIAFLSLILALFLLMLGLHQSDQIIYFISSAIFGALSLIYFFR